MKYILLLILVTGCSSLNIPSTLSKEDFCKTNKISSNCDLIYSYYLANTTLFKQNKALDQFILQHQP
jgi:hypothetical protein